MDGFRSMSSPASVSITAYHVQLLSTVNEGSHSGFTFAKLNHPPSARSFIFLCRDAPCSVKSHEFGSIN